MSSITRSARAAERRRRRGEAADEGGVFGAFKQIAGRIVARMHQQVGAGDALREAAGRRIAFAVGAAIGVRGGGEIGGADLAARRPRARADPRRRRHRRRAQCRRCARAAWPLPWRRGARRRADFRRRSSSRAATACTAASISAICAGNRSRNRPEMRQVTSTRGAAHRRGRQHFDAGDAAGRMVPDRPAAHQRKPLRDLLAAGAQRGAAPQIDDDRARHVAMASADARAPPRRRRAGRGPSRSASAACADRR